MSARAARFPWLFAALLSLLVAAQATADAPPTALPGLASGLQSPAQRSTRRSAYSLAPGVWSMDLGVLGVNADELYGSLGVARGFNHGFMINLNLVHWGAALFNATVRWNFFERRHFALGAEVGFVYAHGGWIWILGDLARDVISDSDFFGMPLGLTASAPINRWLQLDLMVQYRYSKVFGSIATSDISFYADTEFGAQQLVFRPSARLFLSDALALEVSAKLPVYNRVPYEIDRPEDAYRRSRDGYADVAFSESWYFEAGMRARLRTWLFANLRIQVSPVSRNVYGSPVFPAFGLEFRF